MKKLFYISLALSLFSCSSSDDTPADTPPPPPVIQTEKAYVNGVDGIGTPNPKEFYEFTYENGNLTNVKGRFYKIFMQMEDMFFADKITTLSYSNNKVILSELEGANFQGYQEYRFTMDNNKPVKQEHYYVNNVTGPGSVADTKTYTYEQDKLKKIYWKFEGPGGYEYFTTYYYSNNNLTKSEVIEKISGIDNKLTTITYSDFDNAANPFKKLYLLNNELYEKSLSANNFRKKVSVTENLNPANGNIPPKTTTKIWNYKYDANGQVLLFFPIL
ncbi:hypothetical protein KYG33_18370 [Chryseobacterium sp. D764]|jgi:hypothetical protein|uniref:hypothetical protein n=1 Tax=unclassified Chryseobacterium TaxID=2593645 RepID=UPI0015C1E2E5|nr:MULTISPECIES: hypothetical protein [unclassified Chryseobacterium]QXU48726.1 hypothetical protein KYG33_18370 [Chryseobacterium sp. D764]CAD0223600.1 conserved exported protein of unknown function [Chryseobacterium sp. JV274]